MKRHPEEPWSRLLPRAHAPWREPVAPWRPAPSAASPCAGTQAGRPASDGPRPWCLRRRSALPAPAQTAQRSALARAPWDARRPVRLRREQSPSCAPSRPPGAYPGVRAALQGGGQCRRSARAHVTTPRPTPPEEALASRRGASPVQQSCLVAVLYR